jgi:hypothetical protein
MNELDYQKLLNAFVVLVDSFENERKEREGKTEDLIAQVIYWKKRCLKAEGVKHTYKVIEDPFKHDKRMEWLIEKFEDQEYVDGLINRMRAEGAFE